ncbi:MAG TPA: hypothetical protein VEB19_00810 [Gemmatimonadaceae bacterium]|nr:hypothetical protein [Gemmatimonadaceae bacterium]
MSPARCDGRRAKALLNTAAEFPLAQQLRSAEGATVGDVFSFLSGLYFRGKLTYASRFATAESRSDVRIITTNRGLLTPAIRVSPRDLTDFACVDLAAAGDSFERPLVADAETLSRDLGPECVAILLGSIATNKYVGPLKRVYGERLLFPKEFIGRGDMSRGGLLLRHAASGEELEYIPVATAVRHGKRPPKLAPIPKVR